MATIKDVAKLAGVSQATVSNVINEKKTVQSKFVEAVEKAMTELGYEPNARAQGLKKNRSNELAIVLPNISESDFAEIYTGFEREAILAGYVVSLFTTDYNKEHEKEILRHIIRQKFGGVVVMTCMPANDDAFRQLENSQIKLVFAANKPQNLEKCAFVGIDYSESMHKLIKALKANNFQEIVLLCGHEQYSSENAIRQLFLENMRRMDMPLSKNSVYIIDPGKENAFSATLRWMDEQMRPEVIIASKHEFAQGVATAINYHNSSKKPLVVTYDKDEILFSQNHDYMLRIPAPYYSLGSKAAKILLNMLQTRKSANTITKMITSGKEVQEINSFFAKENTAVQKNALPHKKLRLLLLKNASANAIRQTLHGFEKSSGIQIDLRTVDYQQLYDASIESFCNGDSDIISICNAWLRQFVQNGFLSKIESNSSAYSTFKKHFPKNMPDFYSSVDGMLYALPYSLDAQLLFYRKDLFENLKLRRLFYEQYRYELHPPEDPVSYADISEFFTRVFNTESPTPYGTTVLGRGVNAIYEILPIFWELGGRFFDESGRLTDDQHIFTQALREYQRLLQCSSSDSIQWESWAQKAKSFCAGTSAMMPLYQAHFMDEYSPFDSAVANNVSICRMPYSHSVLGGWCLGIPQKSESKPEAMLFLKWLYQDKNAIIHNMLGGSIPTKYSLQYSDLHNKTAWMHFALNQLEASDYMLTPNERILNQWEFETLIQRSITAFSQQLISAEDTSAHVFRALSSMLEKAHNDV